MLAFLPIQRRIFIADADIRAIVDADVRKVELEAAWQDTYAQLILAARRLKLIEASVGKTAVTAYVERLASVNSTTE